MQLAKRTVLAHSPNNPSRSNNDADDDGVATTKQGWLSSLASYITGSTGTVEQRPERRDRDFLTFNEAAPYLVTSRASLRDVSSRLPPGEETNMIVFRPNIVVDDDYNHEHEHPHAHDSGGDDGDHDSGYDGSSDDGTGRSRGRSSTSLKPYEEDYWAELLVRSGSGGRDGPRLALTANCARCVSINIDYETGRPAEGERGSVLKKLMKDRRVDTGNKWSPIFGRYAFLLLTPGSAAASSAARQRQQQQQQQDEEEGDEGGEEDEDVVAEAEAKAEATAVAATAAADIAVGDEVRVTRRVSDRDVWSWPKTS
ncbi:hypothetical protein SLS62_003902 [Diatrype stigma]|uniref:MOSC domain-containing protein n=1 Tax=Diatrype stigma TaxID=117547 RepID=A0AAN9YQY2_9PEZI